MSDANRWTESVDKEEYLVCTCGRIKAPGGLWGIVPRNAMVDIFKNHPVSYMTCQYCKVARRTEFDNAQLDAFDAGI